VASVNVGDSAMAQAEALARGASMGFATGRSARAPKAVRGFATSAASARGRERTGRARPVKRDQVAVPCPV